MKAALQMQLNKNDENDAKGASLREKLIKIGAKVISHGRYVTFQLAEVSSSSERCLPDILSLITRLRHPGAEHEEPADKCGR